MSLASNPGMDEHVPVCCRRSSHFHVVRSSTCTTPSAPIVVGYKPMLPMHVQHLRAPAGCEMNCRALAGDLNLYKTEGLRLMEKKRVRKWIEKGGKLGLATKMVSASHSSMALFHNHRAAPLPPFLFIEGSGKPCFLFVELFVHIGI